MFDGRSSKDQVVLRSGRISPVGSFLYIGITLSVCAIIIAQPHIFVNSFFKIFSKRINRPVCDVKECLQKSKPQTGRVAKMTDVLQAKGFKMPNQGQKKRFFEKI
jgi:hypothetical protein